MTPQQNSEMTPYQSFVAKWGNCTACPLCNTRDKIVLGRGFLPCDVLFIGEAPGPSENRIGLPFIGPAGRLLDQIIGDARQDSGKHNLRLAFTNLVCCLPTNGDTEEKTGEPKKAEIEACSDRLKSFIRIANPRLIVAVGDLSRKWGKLQSNWNKPLIHITHPSHILQTSIAARGLEIQRCIVNLSTAFEDL